MKYLTLFSIASAVSATELLIAATQSRTRLAGIPNGPIQNYASSKTIQSDGWEAVTDCGEASDVVLVNALDGSGDVSFRSIYDRNLYYRHRGGKVHLDRLPGNGGRALFNADASWKLVPTPCASPKKAIAFESVNFPDRFLIAKGEGQ